MLSLLLAQVRRTHEAKTVLEAIDDTVQARAEVTASATLARSGVALAGGHFEDAARLAASGLAEADRTGFLAWAPLGHFVLVQTALRRGHLSTAVRYARKLKEDAVFQRELLPAGLAAWAVIQVADLGQGHRSAAPLAAELLADESAMRQLTIADPAALPWLVRLVTAAGRPRAAATAVRIARQLAGENPHFDSLRATAWHATGLYEGDVALLRLAVRHHADPWVRAAADEDIAVLLSGRTGEPEIPELTETEYAVAALVASGFTNGQTAGRLYLSPHTVAFHLRKIFRKLDVASRVQLASRWRELPGHREHVTRRTARQGEPMREEAIVK
ncbi:response regulator transcription factor [Amycolatopsis magusensis]|uniref:response regulator transcription factor n=1 Tax=Amycolatopsis magusensis TaxID=882444 RepID=UPI003798819D